MFIQFLNTSLSLHRELRMNDVICLSNSIKLTAITQEIHLHNTEVADHALASVFYLHMTPLY